MGKTFSSMPNVVNRESDTEAVLETAYDGRKAKLVLLGPGKCGKTSIFKQFKLCYGDDEKDITDERERIRRAVFQCFESAIQIIKTKYRNICEDATLNRDLGHAFPAGNQYQTSTTLSSSLLYQEKVSLLKKFSDTDRFKLFLKKELLISSTSDSFSYFVKHFDRVFDEDYVPTTEDYLRCDITTAGIEEQMFQYKKMNCFLLDTGGQRAERSKWLNTFDDVSAVIFVASLGDFNELYSKITAKTAYKKLLDSLKK